MVDVLVWLLFGSIIGISIYLLDSKQNSVGKRNSIVLGIIGSVIGGIFANIVFGLGVSGFTLTTLSIALSGSLILFLLGKLFIHRNS